MEILDLIADFAVLAILIIHGRKIKNIENK